MKRVIRILIIIIVVIIAVSVFLDFLGVKNGEEIRVTVPEGVSGRQIVEILAENDIINNALLFRAYSRKSIANATAGVHYMRKDMGYKAALSELCSAALPFESVKVIIPEGFELREIAELLEKNGIVTAEEFYDTMLTVDFDYSFLKGVEKDERYLEGYLFPATYDFSKEMSAKTVINTMLKRFEQMLSAEYLKDIKQSDLTLRETVILASVIEREAAKESERATVSSVFHNRLKINMPLQSCATVEYILKERKSVLSVEDTKIKSPYNTYINYGLPKGPIASPGEASFKAAIYPAKTDYLYFVADGTGGHTFSKTYSQHLEANR